MLSEVIPCKVDVQLTWNLAQMFSNFWEVKVKVQGQNHCIENLLLPIARLGFKIYSPNLAEVILGWNVPFNKVHYRSLAEMCTVQSLCACSICCSCQWLSWLLWITWNLTSLLSSSSCEASNAALLDDCSWVVRYRICHTDTYTNMLVKWNDIR